MLMLMSAFETGQMSAVETRHFPPSPAALRGLDPPLLGRVGVGAKYVTRSK